MGLDRNVNSGMQADKTANGDCGLLANIMNEFVVPVGEHLPRLNEDNHIFVYSKRGTTKSICHQCDDNTKSTTES